jgi:hypothetical protein
VVLAETGAPPPSARILCLLRDRHVGGAVVDESGRFEAKVPPGELTLRITYFEGREPVTLERKVTTRDGEVSDLEIRIGE